MLPIQPKLAAAALAVFLTAGAAFPQTLSHSRSYSWGMERGNLIPNWSFENTLQFWTTATPSGYTVDPHYKAATVSEGGSFVGRVTGTSPASGPQERLVSGTFPLEPYTTYTLSFYYTAASMAGQTWPEVWFYRDRNNPITFHPGTAYAAAGGFTLYVTTFTTPEDANYAKLILASSGSQGHGGTFQFDNVILEEGWLGETEVQAIRARTGLSVGFGDALGRTHQTQTRIGIGKYRVEHTAFEEFARPESTFLPISVTSTAPAFRSDAPTLARTLYNGTSGVPDAGGYPFTEMKYAAEPGSRVVAKGSPGNSFRLSSTHEVFQGFYFTSSLLVQAIPANIQSPAVDAAQRDYRVDWTRDADSNFTLTWTNRQGQLIQEAQNLTRGGTSAANWTYSLKQYEYYTDGRLKRTRSPLDVQNSSLKFAEVNEYNTLGKLISSYTKNSGLTRFWYNRRGDLRFSQDSGQRMNNEFTYRDYDTQGRIFSQGIQVLPSVSQVVADFDVYSAGTKQEHIGYVYDDYEQIAPRIGGGLTLDQIIPYHNYMDKRNGRGRLVCKYNRNLAGRHPGFGSLDNLVADFYGYDTEGLLRVRLKAAHPIRDAMKKFQDAYFLYDESQRLIESYNYVDASSGTMSTRHHYYYDLEGRMQRVVGQNDKPLAEFSYQDWGPMKQMILGGNGTGAQGTKVEYFYHIQGWLKEIKCTNLSTGKITFQEFLGYEGKAHSATQVPGLTKPRFSGQVTQMLYSLGRDVNSLNPVRLVNYNYDELGRMLAADYRKNSNTDPFNTDESINFGAPLAWNTTSNENDSYFAYDLNGRVTGQRSANVASADSLRYTYGDGTYKLDFVNGKVNNTVNRPMSASGTFVYDDRGRLTWDNSKQLEIHYGWDNLPVEFITYQNGAPEFQYDYFDAEGSRVSRFKDGGGTYTGTHYLRMGTGISKEWRETYSSGGAVTSSESVVNLFGTKQVGRIRPDGIYEFVLKNHLGSTIKTVTESGASGNNTYDYLAYGDLRKLKEVGGAAGTVTEKFTGKEYENISRLYYFGARHYDPELGLWFAPDAGRQYLNPYSYAGGETPFKVDPDGNWALIDDLIATGLGATAGYVCYGIATGDWFSGQALAMAAVGAAAGEAALYTGGATLALLGPGLGSALAAGTVGGAVGGAVSGFGGYGVGAAAGDYKWNTADALKTTGISTATGMVSGFAGAGASKVIGSVVIGGTHIGSPVVKGMFAGAAGGYAGGFVGGYISTGTFSGANSAGLGAIPTGVAMGGLGGYASAKAADINPWSGKPNNSIVIGEGMDSRVKPMAKTLGSSTIEAEWPDGVDAYFGKNVGQSNTTSEAMDFNGKWIEGHKSKGTYMYDIGPKGETVQSQYYNSEVGRTMYYDRVLEVSPWKVGPVNGWYIRP